MLICEGPSQIGVRFEAPWFIRGKSSHLGGQETAMRIVAVDTAHGALRKPVRMRALECGPIVQMASGTLLIDSLRFSSHQAFRIRLMHAMTTGAGNTALGVTALDSPDMRGLIAMAGEACFIHLRGGQLSRISDVTGRDRFDMLA